MGERRHILVISTGEFSGTKNSVVRALKEKDCYVSYVRISLHRLRLWPLYRFLMYAHALGLYGFSAKKYVHRTPTAAWVLSKACQAIIDAHSDIDAVMLLQGLYPNFSPAKSADVKYCVYTDHVNILSKKSPSYGFPAPEKNVHSSWNNIEQFTLTNQDYIFVMGEHVRDCIVEEYGIAHEKVFAVGGGPNLDVDVERDRLRKDFSGRNIVFVGLDAERKGLSTLKKAFEIVRAEFPEARLHVVGVDGESADGTLYYGRLAGEPLKDLLYKSQIFAMPTHREPFGIAFLEAMWAKLACVGSSVGALPEIIEESRTGFLVRPGDHIALAERISELFRDSHKLKAMCEAGYIRAAGKYSWAYSAEQMTKAMGYDSTAPERNEIQQVAHPLR